MQASAEKELHHRTRCRWMKTKSPSWFPSLLGNAGRPHTGRLPTQDKWLSNDPETLTSSWHIMPWLGTRTFKQRDFKQKVSYSLSQNKHLPLTYHQPHCVLWDTKCPQMAPFQSMHLAVSTQGNERYFRLPAVSKSYQRVRSTLSPLKPESNWAGCSWRLQRPIHCPW